ncbi:MAG: hypothetical protein KatS3mg021_0625 [Fimbriimonadales bacterium]|jgi:hypothetical protein|nr:MAG: hypothetical protein KatS3mg021_0625 [Fimbriimonadales bacterium]
MKYYEVIGGSSPFWDLGPTAAFQVTLSDIVRWWRLLDPRVEPADPAGEFNYLPRWWVEKLGGNDSDFCTVTVFASRPPVHLCSPRLRWMVQQQGLVEGMQFFPVSVYTQGRLVDTFFAVRYSASVCVPCLKSLPIYRPVADSHKGYKVYRRRGSQLILDAPKIGDLKVFRVVNEEQAPLVVREDVIEQWWQAGIHGFELEDVVLE